MYNQTMFMNKYLKEGYNSLFGLTKKEYNQYRLRSDNDYNLLNDIYLNLGYENIFSCKSDNNLVETVIAYFVSNSIQLNPTEVAVADTMKDKLEGDIVAEMKDVLLELDGKVINLKKDILGKTNRQIKELMEIIESDYTCIKIFDRFRRGIVKDKELDGKVTKFLKANLKVYQEDTNIAIKELNGKSIEIYFPETEVNLRKMDPIEYVKSLIYAEVSDPAMGFINYSTRMGVMNHLNQEGSIYTMCNKNPLTLFYLEFYRRRFGLDSVQEVLEDVCHIGGVVDHSPNTMCYHGNLDETITLHVKNTEAVIEQSYLGTLINDNSIEFFVSRGIVDIKSDKSNGRITLWQHLLGNSAKPKDGDYNNITNLNIQ